MSGAAGAVASPALPAADPFDALASGYDASFTDNPLGRRMRAAVERRLVARFAAGDRVLDLGCGTGEDAVRLARRGIEVVAIDASPAMVAAARAKVAVAGVGERVTVRRGSIEELLGGAATALGVEVGLTTGRPAAPGVDDRSTGEGRTESCGLAVPPTTGRELGRASVPAGWSTAAGAEGDLFGPAGGGAGGEDGSGVAARVAADARATPLSDPLPLDLFVGGFDGVLSNFGALNCVGDLSSVAAALGRLVRPGGTAVLCAMGPFAPWEWLLGALRLDPRLALRRLRPGGARWRGRIVRYPSPRALRRAFAPWFAAERLAAVGALLPPPALAAGAARHPRLLDRLDRLERRWETLPPLPWLADHYLLELVRR